MPISSSISRRPASTGVSPRRCRPGASATPPRPCPAAVRPAPVPARSAGTCRRKAGSPAEGSRVSTHATFQCRLATAAAVGGTQQQASAGPAGCPSPAGSRSRRRAERSWPAVGRRHVRGAPPASALAATAASCRSIEPPATGPDPRAAAAPDRQPRPARAGQRLAADLDRTQAAWASSPRHRREGGRCLRERARRSRHEPRSRCPRPGPGAAAAATPSDRPRWHRQRTGIVVRIALRLQRQVSRTSWPAWHGRGPAKRPRRHRARRTGRPARAGEARAVSRSAKPRPVTSTATQGRSQSGP